MKENKEKNMASGAKGEDDIRVQDAPTPLVVKKSIV